MTDLYKEYRKAFSSYVKNPQEVAYQKALIVSASAITKDAVMQFGVNADEYVPYIFEKIRVATKGIKLSPDTAEILEDFIDAVGSSDVVEEKNSYVTLCITLNLATPKISCLREVLNNFLMTQDKLKKEDEFITNKNFAGSFFLSNSDVSNIRAKKVIIDNLLNSVSTEIFNESSYEGVKFFPVGNTLAENIQHIENHIDSLSEDRCGEVLSNLLQKINPVLNAEANPDAVTKQSVLKVHEFSDTWIFNFLAKMVKTIKEALGMKTSTELLLEDSVNEAKQSGINLK